MTPPHGRTVRGDDEETPALPPDPTMLEQTRAPVDSPRDMTGEYTLKISHSGPNSYGYDVEITEGLDGRSELDVLSTAYGVARAYRERGPCPPLRG